MTDKQSELKVLDERSMRLVGEINIAGHLSVHKNGRRTVKCCVMDRAKFCGDWCPLFREPIKSSRGTIKLQICQHESLEFDELIDRR